MEGQLNEIPGSILAIPQMLMVIFDSWDIGNSSIILTIVETLYMALAICYII
jgi:hypothetical protein